MLVDSHCHLDFPDFPGELDGIVARARAAGIALIVTISTRYAEVLAIAERFPDVDCSVGTHPHHVQEELDIGVDELIARAPSQGGRDRRGRARLSLRTQPARGAGARLSQSHRRRARDWAAPLASYYLAALPVWSSRLSIVYRRCEKRPQTACDKKGGNSGVPAALLKC
jgi:TatD related DNase